METREANQAAFEKVVRHLLRQNAKSEGESQFGEVRCEYRGPGGRMCAVGCLIPDSEYQPSMEGLDAWAAVNRCPSLVGLNVSLLQRLQDVHDHDSVSRWPASLLDVAASYGLTMPDLESAP